MANLELSNYLRNKILDHVNGTATYTKPTTVHIALYTTDPTVSDSGTEVSGSGYARQAVTFGSSSAGAAQNTSAHTFSATGSWGTVAYAGIRDASIGGNLLWFSALDASIAITASGQGMTFSAGAITVQFPASV